MGRKHDKYLLGLKCAQLIAADGARRAWRAQPHSARLADEAGVLGALATTAALSGEGLAWNRTVRAYVRANCCSSAPAD